MLNVVGWTQSQGKKRRKKRISCSFCCSSLFVLKYLHCLKKTPVLSFLPWLWVHPILFSMSISYCTMSFSFPMALIPTMFPLSLPVKPLHLQRYFLSSHSLFWLISWKLPGFCLRSTVWVTLLYELYSSYRSLYTSSETSVSKTELLCGKGNHWTLIGQRSTSSSNNEQAIQFRP